MDMARVSEFQSSRGPVVIESSTPTTCSSCGRLLAPYEKAVRFTCPSCGVV